MLTFRHPRKIVCADLSPEAEVRRKSTLPLTADVLFLRVVGLCAAGEFLRVISLRLARTQRRRDGEHQSKYGICSTAESAWARADALLLSTRGGPSFARIAVSIS